MPTARDTMCLSIRTNFAIQHLQAAVRAGWSAYEVEQANAAADFNEMLLWVPVSVVMAGAALEAGANEVIQNILDGSTELPLTDSRKMLLKDLNKERSGNATARYREVALLFDKVPDTGSSPWQDAALLVGFRNSFMHFKPSWDRDDIHNSQMVKALRKKIPIVPAYKGKFLFPYGFMTYGCAKWVVETVLTFSIEFTKLLGVKDAFALPGRDFRLP